MVEAAYAPRTPVAVAPERPVMRLASLPGLDSPVVFDARDSVRHTIEAATTYEGLGYKAAVGQSHTNGILAATLTSSLSKDDPALRARQERALDGLTHNSNGKQVATVYEDFARASAQPSPAKLTTTKTNPLDAFLAQPQKLTPVKRLKITSASTVALGPAAFGKTGKFSNTLAQGSKFTYSKATLSQAALRGPVSVRMPIAESVAMLNAARRNGPALKPAPVFEPAPAFTVGSKPAHYGHMAPSFSMGPR